MILTNCTDSPRGLTLKNGIKILEGREMWNVPLEQQDEIRAMFASKTFQRFVDNDVFRLGELGDDEAATTVKTPEPPATLTGAVEVEGLAHAAGTTTGTHAAAPHVVEYQQGGAPAVETGKNRRKK